MKNTQILSILSLAALALLTLASCEKADTCDPQVNEDGLTREVTDLVPQDVLDEIERLGMPIFGGVHPPDLEGSYFVSPFILLASNRPGDVIGSLRNDMTFTLYSQDNQGLTINLDYELGPEKGTGLGSFIVGEGNRFSVFAEVIAESEGETAKGVNVLSGEITANGIKDLYYGFFMIDNGGNPKNIWIENGEGRVNYDSDGVSERL